MIDPRAIVDPSAQIAEDVSIGPWSMIGADVTIGPGTRVESHVVIKGPTTIGANNRIFQFASVGEDCQDKKFKGEPTRLEIGDNNTIREGVTIQRGTVQDECLTKIGNDNLFMVYSHVAHDVVMGDHCILANNVAVAGHVHLGNHVILGGLSGVHQFCQIGSYAMCGAGTIVLKDIPAFVMSNGNPAKPHGMNFEGMKRRGFSREAIRALRQAYKIVYRQGLTVADACEQLDAMAAETPEVKVFVDSIRASTRSIIR